MFPETLVEIHTEQLVLVQSETSSFLPPPRLGPADDSSCVELTLMTQRVGRSSQLYALKVCIQTLVLFFPFVTLQPDPIRHRRHEVTHRAALLGSRTRERANRERLELRTAKENE
ncbi:hypothetical protein EYF80_061083 [Liparis tanakae]|uniref:Uncharacterized protein n=1 Tax=Liparis tanakae TaxID=230148 RepID=A0A4Z2EIY6_9TELE|nr:hypothetical protein EYF80_061083 [Liparis tanakae]